MVWWALVPSLTFVLIATYFLPLPLHTHALFLRSSPEPGTVWSWGAHKSRQLGCVVDQNAFEPLEVQNLGHTGKIRHHITHLSIADGISAAVADSGECWIWGREVDSSVPILVS
jgi:alpha-tubulin suppressor-like RCC1 family protein